jgi:3-methyl-2-oxobutanoate hydroxymethyltransferase
MSIQSAIRRKTAPDIRVRKNGEPIVMLTSYHAHTAAIEGYAADVRARAFPGPEHVYGMKPRS